MTGASSLLQVYILKWAKEASYREPPSWAIGSVSSGSGQTGSKITIAEVRRPPFPERTLCIFIHAVSLLSVNKTIRSGRLCQTVMRARFLRSMNLDGKKFHPPLSLEHFL